MLILSLIREGIYLILGLYSLVLDIEIFFILLSFPFFSIDVGRILLGVGELSFVSSLLM